MSQVEAVDIVMCLEATLGGDETSMGLAHVHSQLSNIMMQLQDIAKIKVMRKHVWCTTCCVEGKHKDECLVLMNYVTMGAPSPFPTK
jgi:hypothetical protein